MNANLLNCLLSILLMSVLGPILSTSLPSSHIKNNFSKHSVNSSKSALNITYIAAVQNTLKKDVSNWNCTNSVHINVTADVIERTKNASSSLDVFEFCNSMSSNKFSNACNVSSINYVITQVFTNLTRCISFCTVRIDLVVWPYCEIVRNLTQVPKKKNVEEAANNKTETINITENVTQIAVSNISGAAIHVNNENKSLLMKDGSNSTSGEPEKTPVQYSNPIDTESEAEESNHLIYFALISILCIVFYIVVYNKKKIFALMIEGRKHRDKRRNASAGYRKLNTNLEEAMPFGTSPPSSDSLIY